MLLLEALGKNPSCLFLASDGCWASLEFLGLSLQALPVWSHMCPLLMPGHQPLYLGFTAIQHNLNLIISTRALFPVSSYSQVPRVGTLIYLFRGHLSPTITLMQTKLCFSKDNVHAVSLGQCAGFSWCPLHILYSAIYFIVYFSHFQLNSKLLTPCSGMGKMHMNLTKIHNIILAPYWEHQ